MSREFAVLLFLTLPAVAAAYPLGEPVKPAVLEGDTAAGLSEGAKHGRLTWTAPCVFTHEDGAPYAGVIQDFHCDFLRASVKDAGAKFDKFPGWGAQDAFLRTTSAYAVSFRKKYEQNAGDVLAAMDPDKIAEGLPPEERLQHVMTAFSQFEKGYNLCKPFLWPEVKVASYLESIDGGWPETWRPCMEPFYQRLDRLHALARVLEGQVVAAVVQDSARAIKDLSASQMAAALAAKKGLDAQALDEVFDGKEAGGKTTPAAAALPLTPEEREKRHYLARGLPAALERIKDDAQITVWHAQGETRTIGDPLGKASLNVAQKGPTCGIAVQYQAMRARGMEVDIAELTKKAHALGLYTEFETPAGGLLGGVYSSNIQELLKDHGVTVRPTIMTTPEELTNALRRTGDAIVSLSGKRLWNLPAPDVDEHIVYVTGAEVDAAGRARGYYINDSGNGGEAARFIPIDRFVRMWKPMKNRAVLFYGRKT
jgi:hypothetical protein